MKEINKKFAHLGYYTQKGQALNIALASYREIVFRVLVQNAAYLYQAIPVAALATNGQSEITFYENDSTHFSASFYVSSTQISLIDVICTWNNWSIELIGII